MPKHEHAAYFPTASRAYCGLEKKMRLGVRAVGGTELPRHSPDFVFAAARRVPPLPCGVGTRLVGQRKHGGANKLLVWVANDAAKGLKQ